MPHYVDANLLIANGANPQHVNSLVTKINRHLEAPPEIAWNSISKEILLLPFQLHLCLFSIVFPNWRENPDSAPAWLPDEECLTQSNIAKSMHELSISTFTLFHSWSVNYYLDFWKYTIDKLNIIFHSPPSAICKPDFSVENPHWLPDAKLNIIDSCFIAEPSSTAIIYLNENNQLTKMTYNELNKQTNRIANSLVAVGISVGDRIAIDMPMTKDAVALYLAIIKMGAVVVSIADSFSSNEIATRLHISKSTTIFTQDYIYRSGKKIPLYEKVVAANPEKIVVIRTSHAELPLRSTDIEWDRFLVSNENFTSQSCSPDQHCNILFSSGTTGQPKAIPWTHVTPIKVASDAYYHQNIKPGDVLAWPTNLGWMMGPWLIFAALINQATIALYTDSPNERAFGEFIQDANVTMLGVIPTFVSSWRQSTVMEGLNWKNIKVFSSTAECSNSENMLYLMYLANYKPIIEYCGGTEIGGSYITSTVVESNFLSVFTTAAMGLDLLILDEHGKPSNYGEVTLIPPSIGLSNTLINANHHDIYFANMPTSTDGKQLRRHGDQLHRFASGRYCVLGRADDTMNLGGIKVSSAEIERVLTDLPDITETAAIAIEPHYNGPSLLIIYAATQAPLHKDTILKLMQAKINQHLNPLFKIYDIVLIDQLPKTASNKIMRRVLRTQYKTLETSRK